MLFYFQVKVCFTAKKILYWFLNLCSKLINVLNKSVKPFLDEAVGEDNWKVDTSDERKVLTVTTTEDEEEVVEAVTDAGFKIQKLKE